jgi:hypothetical protein
VTGFPLDSSFRPQRWLRGRHLQTILSSLPPRRNRVERRATPILAASAELLLECGDGVTLQAFHASPRAAAVNPANASRCCCMAGKAAPIRAYVLSVAQTCSRRTSKS